MKPVDGGAPHRHRDSHSHSTTPEDTPFHLLEITIISAQELYPAVRCLKTYASAWVDPEHKLYTRVDRAGHADPTWNDKLVFRVDDAFLRSDMAAVTVHLHATRGRFSPLPDHLLGTVRVVLSALGPAAGPRRCVALQVRRPSSLRPHGILNLGVAILDSFAKNMPLYYDLNSKSAFAYKDLIGAKRGKSNGPRWPSIDCDGWQPERNGSVEMASGVEEREREELRSKLEMWKTEVTPDHEADDRSNCRDSDKRRRRRGSSGRLSCFSYTGEVMD
ncbi:unnamed protein product [Musa acuminata var. zebrina]